MQKQELLNLIEKLIKQKNSSGILHLFNYKLALDSLDGVTKDKIKAVRDEHSEILLEFINKLITKKQLQEKQDEICYKLLDIAQNLPNSVFTNETERNRNIIKKEREINFIGKNGTYIENYNKADTKATNDKATNFPTSVTTTEKTEITNNNQPKTMENNPTDSKTPKTTIEAILEFIGQKWKHIILAVLVIVLFAATFITWNYVSNTKSAEPDKKEANSEKVFVSGILRVDNAVPKLNEIKSLSLKNVDANPARVDALGTFTFEKVKIPANKRLLVEVAFSDGKIAPTQELIVGEVDKETQTVRLPDIYVSRKMEK